MDNTDCLVCLSRKAACFCRDCKQSSGICWDCYFELDLRQDCNRSVKCVICKVPMDKVKINFIIKYDLEINSGELCDFNRNKTSSLKQERLNCIIASNQFDEYEDDISFYSKRHRQLVYAV